MPKATLGIRPHIPRTPAEAEEARQVQIDAAPSLVGYLETDAPREALKNLNNKEKI